MSILLRLERRVEAIVEGFFSRLAHDRVHPVEIGRRLLREMDQGAVAGFHGMLVPNEYQVFLHPHDFAPYASFTAPLVRELEDALRARVHELGAQVPGPVRVSLGSREEITVGEIYVEARLVPGPAESPSGVTAGRSDASGAVRPSDRIAGRAQDGHGRAHAGDAERPHDSDAARTPDRGRESEEGPSANLAGEAGESEPESTDTRVYRRGPGTLRLRVQAGPAGTAGQELALDRPVMTIGRRADQDIILNDPSVSRSHARLEITPQRVSIMDLDSTNGTLVNGHPVRTSRVALRPGDRIQVGTVLLELLSGS